MRKPWNPEEMFSQARRACFTEAEAKKENENLAKALSRLNGGSSTLAHRLLSCSSDDRCDSAACVQCRTDLQVRQIKKTVKLACSEHVVWHAVTVVPGTRVRLGKATATNLIDAPRKELVDILREEGLSAIGAVDVSENEHHEDAWDPHFQPHMHLLVPGAANNIKRRLSRHYRATRIVPIPVKVTQYDGDGRWIAYLTKPDFARRQTYLLPEQKFGSDRYGTRTKPMLVPQRVTLAEALHEGRVSDRTVRVGIVYDRSVKTYRLSD